MARNKSGSLAFGPAEMSLYLDGIPNGLCVLRCARMTGCSSCSGPKSHSSDNISDIMPGRQSHQTDNVEGLGTPKYASAYERLHFEG